MGELSIRTADWKDLPEINLIYQYARKFMAEMGNPAQWGKKFPLESQIKKDIENRQLYVVETGKGICGVFALIIGPNPTYAEIRRWPVDVRKRIRNHTPHSRQWYGQGRI